MKKIGIVVFAIFVALLGREIFVQATDIAIQTANPEMVLPGEMVKNPILFLWFLCFTDFIAAWACGYFGFKVFGNKWGKVFIVYAFLVSLFIGFVIYVFGWSWR